MDSRSTTSNESQQRSLRRDTLHHARQGLFHVISDEVVALPSFRQQLPRHYVQVLRMKNTALPTCITG